MKFKVSISKTISIDFPIETENADEAKRLVDLILEYKGFNGTLCLLAINTPTNIGNPEEITESEYGELVQNLKELK